MESKKILLGLPDVVIMTKEQLIELGEKIAEVICSKQSVQHGDINAHKRFVYGLHGIAELFNVSLVTAQKYRNTFLAPAVMQRGRKLVIDADKAIELFDQQRK